MDQDILDAATELFAANGYTGTSTRDIGERVGLDKTSLYYYFRSKEEILFQVLTRLRDRGELRMQAIESLDVTADERLAAAIRAHGREIRDQQAESRVFLIESRHVVGGHRAELSRFRRSYENHFCDLIKQGQSDGLFDPKLDPMVVTRGLLAMVNGIFYWQRAVKVEAFDGIVETYIGLILDGIRTSKAAAVRPRRTKRASSAAAERAGV